MIRIAEAHARLMFREEVTIQDAVMAVCIMECSMQNTALLQGLMNPLHTSFPKVSESFIYIIRVAPDCNLKSEEAQDEIQEKISYKF